MSVVTCRAESLGRKSIFRRWWARRVDSASFFALPKDVSGYRLTWKRLWNLYRTRYEAVRCRTILRSRPTRLVVEPTNTCNLRCPLCHTGAGRFGRKPGMLRLDVYRKALDEIGDYLFLIEVFNWGEALLNPQLPEIIDAARARGISSRVNTNLSVSMTTHVAERLVSSGLTDLFVSVDGATQEIYQRYRVGGSLDRVVNNCRLLSGVKRRLGSELPRMTLQFLEFPWNVGEDDAMRRLAADLGMSLFAIRGAVPDPEWGRRYEGLPWFMMHEPRPCPYLWQQPVLTVDGNIAPCRGVFQSSDDIVHLSVEPKEEGAKSFQEAWNHERYRTSRRFFRSRDATAEERQLVCHDCPTAIFWERWKEHEGRGGSPETFDPGMELSANGAWNYFWQRGQVAHAPTGRIELT